MNFSIIIVNFKTEKYIVDCILSLRSYCAQHRFEIIVVDNGSDNVEFVEILVDLGVKYCDAGDNVGFGRACNLGARIARGDIFVFVNPDIIFIGDALELLQKGFQNVGERAIVGLNLIGDDSLPSYSAGRFPSLSLEIIELFYAHRWMRRYHAQLALAQTFTDCAEIKEVDYVSGALFGISRQTFIRLGGFNSNIFLYFEETELMFRHYKNGGHVYLMGKVTAVHKGSVSTGANSDFKLHHMELGRHVFYNTRYHGLRRYLTRIVRGIRLVMAFLSQKRLIYLRLIPTALFGRFFHNLK